MCFRHEPLSTIVRGMLSEPKSRGSAKLWRDALCRCNVDADVSELGFMIEAAREETSSKNVTRKLSTDTEELQLVLCGVNVDKNAATAESKQSADAGQGSKKRVSLKDFTLIKVIGKGSFGKVMLVRKIDTNRIYAMKVLSKENIVKRNQVEHTKTERNVQGYIRHPFIVTLRFAFQVCL